MSRLPLPFSWRPFGCVLAIVPFLNASRGADTVTHAEAVHQQAANNAKVDAAYAAKKASLDPARRAWEDLLDANLGSFYLPLHKSAFVAGTSTAWDYVADDPALPSILIIGDSISRGYTQPVRRDLAGKANVHRAPENCGGTQNGLKKLDIWLQGRHWDVITWNFGIHDNAVPADEYRSRLETLWSRLHATGARLIWVRTTPPPPPGPKKDGFNAETWAKVNRVADEVMAEHGVPELDLPGLLQPRLSELQLPQNVHFREEGYEVMGRAVADAIMRAAPPAR